MSTRRTFLKTATALAGVCALNRANSTVAATPVPATAPALMSGLFFDHADIPRIRANLELPRFATLRAKLFGRDLAAEELFLRDEIKLTDHIMDQAKARGILEHAALVYALTGEKRELALARLAIQRLGAYAAWDYFLEGGTQVIGLQRAPETTIAFCLALDWLGAELSAAERAAMEEQIATKGAPACFLSLYGMKYPDRVRGWSMDPAEKFPGKMDLSRWPLILNATNLKIIPTCALGLAAICLQGRHPDAARWLELAQQSAQSFATMYGSDGSFDERFFESLRKSFEAAPREGWIAAQRLPFLLRHAERLPPDLTDVMTADLGLFLGDWDLAAPLASAYVADPFFRDSTWAFVEQHASLEQQQWLITRIRAAI